MSFQFAILFACFFLSGFAALLYQTVWTRELSFVFGTSEIAVVAVLAAYMGGLALGSALAARFAARVRRPVLVYGLLEFGIAACALTIPFATRMMNALYVTLFGGLETWTSGEPIAASLFQLSAAFVLLLAPTALMGATLPLLTRHAVRRESQIASRVGALYAVNTAGAIVGTLLAAFWLMPEWGLRKTVWIGAGINVVVFVLAALVARGAAAAGTAETQGQSAVARGREPRGKTLGRWILPVIALSGGLSFTLEVVWTRLLGHLLGASIQAFATMLASFLLGIALGSAVAARVATTGERARLGFALSQLGVATFTLLAFGLADRLPAVSAALGAGPAAPLANAIIAVGVLLPATFCIGTTFPLAIRVLTRDPNAAASGTARVYAWNTIGAIVGALGGGYFLLPALGFAGTIALVAAASLVLSLVCVMHLEATRARRPIATACLALGLVLVFAPAADPNRLLASTPLEQVSFGDTILYSAVGRSSSVLVTDQDTHFRLSSNGLPESGIRKLGVLPSTKTAFWLGALPSLLRPELEDLLIVGFGGGVALEFVPPSVRQIDVIEIEPKVIAANRWIGKDRAIDPLEDGRVRVHLGDARGSLRLVDARFGAIVSQPSHPWTAGASHLYTKEFFSLVRSRLRPEGVFVQWIGMAFLDEALLRSILATMGDVFAHVELYRPEVGGLLFVGSSEPIDGIASAKRFLDANPDAFAAFGLESPEDFASAWALDDAGVRQLASRAQLNTDDHNRLATRAARLGKSALSPEELVALLQDHDPLLSEVDGLDRAALLRRVAERGQVDRARALALATPDAATREASLGDLARGAGSLAAARAHFEEALDRAPGNRDALAGAILARHSDWVRDLLAPIPEGAALYPEIEALVSAWRSAAQRDWVSVAKLDALLDRPDPRDPLFEATTRLRVRQRLAIGDREAARQAQRLSERLIRRRWSPYDELVRARAAARAGDSRAAVWSVYSLLARANSNEDARLIADQVSDVLSLLPDEDRLRLESALAAAVGRPGRG